MARKRTVVVALGLLVAVLAIAGGGAALLASLGPRVLIERYASLSLHRRLAIRSLRIHWGTPTTVELRDLRLANRPGGSVPDMVSIASLSAEIEPWSLLSGRLRFRKLDVEKPVIVLERAADGTGNWRFGSIGAPSLQRLGPVSGSRAHFPTLLDFHLHDGEVSYRTSSGVLRIDMTDGTIRADGDDTPVSVSLDGAYNGIPSHLGGETDPFSALRKGGTPFGVSFSLSGASSTIDFKGTLTDPLDFDGADGTLAIEGGNLGKFLDVFDAGVTVPIPFSIDGTAHRDGNRWQLPAAEGRFGDDAFKGTLTLQEGPRAHPDDLALDLRFPELDLRQLLVDDGADAGKGLGSPATLSLRVGDQRGTNIDATLAAAQLHYGKLHFANASVEGALTAGRIDLKRASVSLAGGTVELSGATTAAPAGGHLAASATVSGLSAGEVAAMLGASADEIEGKIDGGASLQMTGATVGEALGSSQGAAVLTMRRGRVARSLLERASTDLRSFFRKSAGSAPIKCLLGVVNLKDGLGTIAPLRLQTNEATLVGGGQLDLPRSRLDLTVKPTTSGPLALDIPFRVSGGLASPEVRPVIGDSTAWLDAPAQNAVPPDLPPDLQQLAARNPC